ncbi:MAG: hypothetical protein OHK0024_01840 [Thalassobaculales bacterium]
MQALKILVVVMGLLIVAGVVVIAVTIAGRLGGAAREAGFGTRPLPEAPVEMTGAGDRLWLRLPSGSVIAIDPATGREVGRLQPP